MNILITGANRGIGLEMVRYSMEQGWRVFACCRNPHNADELFNIAKSSNGQISVHIADMQELSTLQALSYELRNDAIDMLINNAGLYGSDKNKFGSVDVESWLQVFQVNSIAPLKMVEAFSQQLQMGKLKVVACMSSKMGSMADNGYGSSYIYRSSKAALNAVVKSLSIDLKELGIITVALHPGWVKTEMGGPNAEISTRECVEQLFSHLSKLNEQDSGRFIDINGADILW
ncbi:Short-chain dehydrogenase [hydrothermal vent metagenome]|uniref:Short-chain dehydrogenase n=1 Tax=hydrothermal vent metagenome TaxID=652676 RepID=A0A3B0WG70_9ZZZZ